MVTSLDEKQLGAGALRVPTPVGSITDMVCLLKKETSVEELNKTFKHYADGPMKDILAYTEVPLVSMDYVGSPFSCTYDANYTSVVQGKHVQIFGWYDNEWGYSNRVVDLLAKLSEIL